MQRFKDKLLESDVKTFLVRNPLNIIYLTGYWHTTTERPQAVFMNRDDAGPWFPYPGLDRDIVTSWWFGGGRMYFDFLPGEGAFPHEGKVQMGETADLFAFMLEGVKEHQVQGDRIGTDGELYPSELDKAIEVLGRRLQLERHGGGRLQVRLSHEPGAVQQGVVLDEAVNATAPSGSIRGTSDPRVADSW